MSAKAFSSYIYADENKVVEELLEALEWDSVQADNVHKNAIKLVEKIRTRKAPVGQLESFLQQYGSVAKFNRV